MMLRVAVGTWWRRNQVRFCYVYSTLEQYAHFYLTLKVKLNPSSQYNGEYAQNERVSND